MNNVILLGRLVRDPEIHYSTGENANASCRFTLAVQRNYKNSEGNYDADFPSCVAFRQTAEFINKFFHKGDMICVRGRVQTGSYTNKDGIKVYTTDINVETAEFVGGKNSGSGEVASTQPTNKTAKRNDDFMNIPEGSGEQLPW